jgi:hypothetical protein
MKSFFTIAVEIRGWEEKMKWLMRRLRKRKRP